MSTNDVNEVKIDEHERRISALEAAVAALTEIKTSIVKIETVLTNMAEHQIEKRVAKLENWRAYLIGAWAASSVLIATLFALTIKIMDVIKHP